MYCNLWVPAVLDESTVVKLGLPDSLGSEDLKALEKNRLHYPPYIDGKLVHRGY